MTDFTSGGDSPAPSRGAAGELDLHRLAVAMGDLTAGLAEKISPLPAMSPVERERVAMDGLTTLQARGLLTDAELAQLRDVVGTVFAPDLTQQGKQEQAADLLHELVTAGAGPAALAVASIASANVRTVTEFVAGPPRERRGEVAADIGDFSTWQECACAGGIVGATAGIPFGPGGVVLLAAAGAAGGAIGSAIAQELLA